MFKGAEIQIKDLEVLKVEIHSLIKLLFVGFLFGSIWKAKSSVCYMYGFFDDFADLRKRLVAYVSK